MEHHPITAFSARLHQVLDEVLTASAAGLSGESAGDTAVLIARAEARLAALRLRLLEQAAREDTCTGQIAVSEGWWATAASVEHRRSRSDFRLARDLAGDFHRTETALAAGEVTAAQAEVIVDAVRALPPRWVRRAATRPSCTCWSRQASSTPSSSRCWPAPDRRHRPRRRRRTPRRSARRRGASRGPGLLPADLRRRARRHPLQGRDPTLAGDQLRTALNAFASPRRPNPYAREDSAGKKLANADLLGQAFVEMISRYPAGNLPQSGGVNATIMVTMSLDTLLGGMESADLLTGHQLSPVRGATDRV